MTFTAELFLKGLILLIKKKHSGGHYLKSLFKDLPEPIRIQIEERYKYYHQMDKENKELGAYKIVVSKSTKENNENKGSDNYDLEQLLATHNKGFENWRYLHEISQGGYVYEIDFNSLNCFIKAIIDTINLQPNRQRLFLSKKTD